MPAFLVTLWIWRPSDAKFAYEEVPQISDVVVAEHHLQPEDATNEDGSTNNRNEA